jgi:hypothetical protein
LLLLCDLQDAFGVAATVFAMMTGRDASEFTWYIAILYLFLMCSY